MSYRVKRRAALRQKIEVVRALVGNPVTNGAWIDGPDIVPAQPAVMRISIMPVGFNCTESICARDIGIDLAEDLSEQQIIDRLVPVAQSLGKQAGEEVLGRVRDGKDKLGFWCGFVETMADAGFPG